MSGGEHLDTGRGAAPLSSNPDEAPEYAQVIGAEGHREDHVAFVALVDREILPAMEAFERVLRAHGIGDEIDAQDLRSRDAFRGSNTIAFHILPVSYPSEDPTPHPRLECVRFPDHPGQVLLMTSGLSGHSGISRQIRPYNEVTSEFVFDLLDQLARDMGVECGEPDSG